MSSPMNVANLYNLARKFPFIRSLNRTVPPYHTGSVIENRLGLQVFRTIGRHIKRRLRTRIVTADIKQSVDILEKDGILACENFLEPEEFEDVSAEFEAATQSVALAPYKNTE